MQIFFKTRDQARQAKFGKFNDNGKEALAGKRFSRVVAHKKAGKS